MNQIQSNRKTGRGHSVPKQQTSLPCDTQAQSNEPASLPRPRPKAADQLIKRLAACQGPHLKVLVLNNSYLAPARRALQGLLAL